MPRAKKTDTSVSSEKKSTPRKTRTKKTSTKIDLKKYFSELRANLSANRAKYSRYLIVVVIIILVGFLAYLNKQWFVVSVINRQPITTIEFYQNLRTKYGQEILDQLIQTKLIDQEAERAGISINQQELDSEYKKVEDQYGGGESLKALLEQNNVSEKDLRNQVRTRLLVERILGDKVEVTDKEIDDYIAGNPDDPNVLGPTSGEPDREAIKTTLRNNKFGEEFPKWYDEVQKKSSILKFI